MPPSKHRQVPSTSMFVDVEDLSIYKDVSNPSNYNADLPRRLANALDFKHRVIPSISNREARRDNITTLMDTNNKRKLAMIAANAASQRVTVAVKSGWKAGEPDKSNLFTVEQILTTVALYRVALQSLRQIMPQSLDPERSTSALVTKLVNLQLVSK